MDSMFPMPPPHHHPSAAAAAAPPPPRYAPPSYSRLRRSTTAPAAREAAANPATAPDGGARKSLQQLLYDDGGGPPAAAAAAAGGVEDEDEDGGVDITAPTLLQPRVAVVLGLPARWHQPLFACRLLSICPAIWWSLPIALRLLVQLHAALGYGPVSGGNSGKVLSFESRLRLTETCLAMIWCGVAAYLSFFFTDCLMSRWLLNYTPQATIVRLLAINALNGYLTSWVLYLSGGSADPRLLLPAWVAIASTLTGLYHVTQRKINIRKETSTSIGVFSGASFISMVSLLAQLYAHRRADFPAVPLASLARRLWAETARVAANMFDLGNAMRDL